MANPRKDHRKRRKAAAALKYELGADPAPRVAAAGRGLIAERIIALARANGIPVHDDPDLVEVLVQLDAGDVIPVELYQVVAEVLAHVYRMNALAARGASGPRTGLAAGVLKTRGSAQ